MSAQVVKLSDLITRMRVHAGVVSNHLDRVQTKVKNKLNSLSIQDRVSLYKGLRAHEDDCTRTKRQSRPRKKE